MARMDCLEVLGRFSIKRRDIRKGYRGNQSWNQQYIITIAIIYLSPSSPPQEASQTSLNMKTISFFALLSLSPFIPSLAASLPSFEGQVDALQLGTLSTRNDLVDNSPCKAVTLIFARGTIEAGNVGSLVGPPFFSALSFAIGSTNLAVQGVDYPADVPGFLIGGSPSGSNTMATLINRAFAQCPNTKVIISGYSYVSLTLCSRTNHLMEQIAKAHNSSITQPEN